jgi:hypothetical protein
VLQDSSAAAPLSSFNPEGKYLKEGSLCTEELALLSCTIALLSSSTART